MLAYATTIHKSQGSEYPAVVIPLTTQHYTMLARNLLYTGVTRGKKLVVLVGQRKALAIAVKNAGAGRRLVEAPRVARMTGGRQARLRAPLHAGKKPRNPGRPARAARISRRLVQQPAFGVRMPATSASARGCSIASSASSAAA